MKAGIPQEGGRKLLTIMLMLRCRHVPLAATWGEEENVPRGARMCQVDMTSETLFDCSVISNSGCRMNGEIRRRSKVGGGCICCQVAFCDRTECVLNRSYPSRKWCQAPVFQDTKAHRHATGQVAHEL